MQGMDKIKIITGCRSTDSCRDHVESHFIDIDILFNSFLNSYLRIFYSSFPINKFNLKKPNKKPQITDEIPATLQQQKKSLMLS